MTGLDDENRELDDFLARRSVLHRRLADRDRHEPSQELDRLVLDKAREAIEVPAGTPMYRAPRWALPVGLAASVVLALAVVMNFARMDDGRGGGYPVAASASPAADAASGFAEREAAPMAPAPPVDLAKQSTQSFAPKQLRTDSADAASPPRPAAGEPDRASKARVASDAPNSGAGAKPANPPAPAPANSPRFARADAPSERRIVPARDSALREAETATAAASARGPVVTDQAEHPDPQSWMREIEQLRLAGKSGDADREVAAFRKAFPTLPVSPAALGRDPRPSK